MTCWQLRKSSFFLLSLLFFSSTLFAAEEALTSISQGDYEILVVEISVNGKRSDTASIIARNSNNELFVSEDDLHQWDIQPPYPKALVIEGMDLIPMTPLGKIETELDTQNLLLTITLPNTVFEKNLIDLSRKTIDTTPHSDRGLFLSYDLSLGQETKQDMDAAILLKPVVFSEYGHLVNDLVYQNANTSEKSDNFLRIETRLQRDFPERKSSLVIGDSTTVVSPWSRSVRFAGVQYASNFLTQPRFISFPLPSTQSEAALPSDIDIYVNQQLIRSVASEPGVFQINNIPAITGDGEIQLIIKDQLGRETLVSSDFYASDLLLKQGLSAYGYSLGLLRDNFGLRSNDYGSAVGVADYQYGYNDNWTIGARAELSGDVQNLGFNNNFLIKNKGIISSSLALSNSNDTSGSLVKLGYSYNNLNYRIGAGVQTRSDDFEFLGVAISNDQPNSQLNLNASARFNQYGSFGLSYVNQSFNLASDRSISSLSYQKTIKKWFTLSAFYNRISIDGSDSNNRFGILLTRALKNNRTLDAEISTSEQNDLIRAQYRKHIPFGEGSGYRFSLQNDTETQIEADWEQRLAKMHYNIETRNRGEQSGVRFGLNGAITYLNKQLRATREIQSSFALVKVANYPGVRVYQENQLIGETDELGYLLIPNIRPYDVNKLRVEPKDLPLEAAIESLDLIVTPYSNSGVLVNFAVTQSKTYIFILNQENAEPVPAGSVLMHNADELSVVGYDGMVYLSTDKSLQNISAVWLGNHCEFTLPSTSLNFETDDVSELSEITCKNKVSGIK